MRNQIRRSRILPCTNSNNQVKVLFLFIASILIVVCCMIMQTSNGCSSVKDLLVHLGNDASHGRSLESIPNGLSSRISETQRLAVIRPTPKHIKRILFWTSFFNWKDFGFGMGREPFVRAQCRFTNCMTTDDRSLLNQSDACMFHPNDYNSSDLPSIRSPEQLYIFLYYEALVTERYRLSIFNQPLPNFFNWTMTYRRDSDVHSSHPYGMIRRKSTSRLPNALPETLPNRNLRLTDPSLRYHPASANKTKLVAWFASNCVTPGGREVFFRRMADYVPIDIYGACGNLKCPPENGNHCDGVLKTYKFYIAAENSICLDYVTEKLYRALGAGTVPIVYGGADYSAYAPPYSFIHAADFESPKALADYLVLLDRNPGLYSRYFETDWEVVRNPLNGWCKLCEKLNNPVQKPKSYENIGEWWYDEVPCLPAASLLNLYGLSSEPH